MIGDRGAIAINYERRIAYLEPTLEGGAVGAPEITGGTGAGIEWSIRPNPSNGPVGFVFARANDGSVRAVEVFDVLGRAITRVAAAAGASEISWDGTAEGRPLPGGVYFARLVRTDGTNDDVRRLVLIR